MNSDADDRKLQRLFDASRAEDTLGATAFGEVVSGRRAASRTAVRWSRLAAAAAAIAVIGATLVLLHRHSAPEAPLKSRQWAISVTATTGVASCSTVDLKQWEAVSEWRAATDSLLTASDLPLGSGITTPTDSLINAVSGETDAASDSGKEAL